MKIMLLGGYSSDRLDEGMNNITHRLGRELSARHAVRILPLRFRSVAGIRREVNAFRPDILHYLAGPSILSLGLLKIAAAGSPNIRTVSSALHPWFPAGSGRLIPWLRPDIVLTQSRATEERFRRLGCRTAFLSNGVDVELFRPASAGEKAATRAEFGCSPVGFLVLHIGAVKLRRGVESLMSLQESDQQVLVVGSVSSGSDPSAVRALESVGCRVWEKFIRGIEKVYRMADCYVFPTVDPLHAIETPLTVLEAMAANLPVVSTPFGALRETFAEGDGLVFVRDSVELARAVREVRERAGPVRTREKVMNHSWEKIVRRLEAIYNGILGEERP